MYRSSTAAILAAGAAVLCASTTLAAPAFVNGIAIPATTLDLSGDTSGATPLLNQRVGMFSDLYYDPGRKEWWGVGDRGPGGGTLNYDTRVQRFSIDVNPLTGAISNFQVKQTVKFSDPNNLLGAGAGNLNGLAPSPTNVLGRSFDPEGFVVNPKTGNFLVSDEYGPSLYEFNRQGELQRVFQTPTNLLPRNAGTGTPNFAGDTGNTAGKRTNRGFEGLAISADGKFAFAMLQSAMLDEGAGDGVFNRIVKFDITTGKAVAQYAYKMEGSNQGRGISALVALNETEFLVLERNNRGVGVPDGNLASPNKKVFEIDLTGATDVSGIDLDAPGASFTPVTKTASALIDLAANTLAALGNRSPEKWEGLAIGPQLADGDYLILAGTDNDFSITQNGTGTQFDVYYDPASAGRIQCDIGTFNNCIVVNANGSLGGSFGGSTSGYALIPGVLHAYKADDATDLAGYLAPIPEPETLALFGVGLLALYAGRRRKAI